MAIEAAERTPVSPIHREQITPLRADKVAQGREVFEFLAQKRGTTSQEVLRRTKNGRISQQRTSMVKELIEWNEAVLGLTNSELGFVIRRDRTTVCNYKAKLREEREKERLRTMLVEIIEKQIPQEPVVDLFIYNPEDSISKFA